MSTSAPGAVVDYSKGPAASGDLRSRAYLCADSMCGLALVASAAAYVPSTRRSARSAGASDLRDRATSGETFNLKRDSESGR